MMPTSISRCLRAFVRGTLAGNVVFSRRHESTEVRWQLSGGEVGDDGFEELLAEGGVQAERSVDPWEATLDIDLKSTSAYWHALNANSDEESEREIDLASLDGWKWLTEQLPAS